MTLVLVVTFALILIGQFVLIKNKAKNPPPKSPSTAANAEQSSAPTSAAVTQPDQAPETPKASASAAASGERKAASGEVETVVENSLYRIVFTNKGAQAKSWC